MGTSILAQVKFLQRRAIRMEDTDDSLLYLLGLWKNHEVVYTCVILNNVDCCQNWFLLGKFRCNETPERGAIV